MQKWEYFLVASHRALGNDTLNKFGAEGWKLISFVPVFTRYGEPVQYIYHFMRPVIGGEDA